MRKTITIDTKVMISHYNYFGMEGIVHTIFPAKMFYEQTLYKVRFADGNYSMFTIGDLTAIQ